MRRTTNLLNANPFLAWSTLAVKTSEMLLASAVVIHHRSARIAGAGANPCARDRREFILMGREKLEAAAESSQAVALRMADANMRLASLCMRQMTGMGAGLLSMLSAHTPLWSPQGQRNLGRIMLMNYTALASNLSASGAKLAGHGLRPIHSRATANAKRLVYRPVKRTAGNKT